MQTLFTALSDARSAANYGNNTAGQKKNLRDAAEKTLRNRISGPVNIQIISAKDADQCQHSATAQIVAP